MKKVRVGILAATGTVGQRMIQLMEGHPWFEVSAVAASDNSTGKTYAEATRWLLDTPLPEAVGRLAVKPCVPGLECDIVLSSPPSPVAEKMELELLYAKGLLG